MNLLKLIFTLLLFIYSVTSFSQTYDKTIRKQVLQRNKIDTIFKFVNLKDSTETYLKYLGKLQTNKGVIYKILTSTLVWGLSHRATNRILVFSNKNKYLGNYYVNMTYDLPDKIKDNELVFLNTDNERCNPKIVTKLSFDRGIPKQFFLKCKDDFGDMYSFSDNP